MRSATLLYNECMRLRLCAEYSGPLGGAALKKPSYAGTRCNKFPPPLTITNSEVFRLANRPLLLHTV